MLLSPCLPPSWYERDVVEVARGLLGKRLVRSFNGVRVGGLISEAEAYRGEEDLACHARAGLTARTAVMYGPPGHAYIYFTYGMHWMLNAVCMQPGYPAAVLIRAIVPQEGLEVIAQRRKGQPEKHWTNGPAKLTRALAIDGSLNGINLSDPASGLWIEDLPAVADSEVTATARVGIQSVPEPWKSLPWRFVYNSQQPRG